MDILEWIFLESDADEAVPGEEMGRPLGVAPEPVLAVLRLSPDPIALGTSA